ncbi:N-acetyllactosaminide beta-1,3-N-acetylglucosaminyltransferase 2 [Oryzias melastigma]|uniref:N-acetyllactosaminide beta-1,3-N-acetylglucosaminyltransferase 2 n=1 Tax=Oryzias melastigma TaxID=30732 RepID=A0A834CDC7_ORYME|nr:N-acetyllactosaminide beta-1,3-N-acetylglucosaminyltransferase 2 [Oryzias melastigma]
MCTAELEAYDSSSPVQKEQKEGKKDAECGTMFVPRRKVLMLCGLMGFNIFVCVLMGLSWKFGGERGHKKIKIPERFWSRQVLSEAFWNKEQQRLDFINNPLLSAVPA